MLAGCLNLSLNLDPHRCNEIGKHDQGINQRIRRFGTSHISKLKAHHCQATVLSSATPSNCPGHCSFSVSWVCPYSLTREVSRRHVQAPGGLTREAEKCEPPVVGAPSENTTSEKHDPWCPCNVAEACQSGQPYDVLVVCIIDVQRFLIMLK